jgi:hypothetical protein
MSWKKLLQSNRVHRHTTSRQELTEIRRLIARDPADAAIPALSEDRRFATAYNAALQTAKMATFGRHLITAGHTVVVSNSRGPETLADFGHPVLRTAAKSGFRFTLALSSFRLRAGLGFPYLLCSPASQA